MTPSSRPSSPNSQGPATHHTFSRGNCSAYGAAAKTNENWTTISDRAERRRVQNRIAQRAYRQKLKERLQLLERRAAQLSHAQSPRPGQLIFADEDACYAHLLGPASTGAEEACHHCLHHGSSSSRTGTASPPSYASYSNHSSQHQSPNLRDQQPAMMPFFQDMPPPPSFPMSGPTDLPTHFISDDANTMGMTFPFMPAYGDMPMMKFELDDLQSPFLNC